MLDGYVARLNRKRQSVLGADLDSLADVISFGVAPAVLGFTLGLRGGWDMVILTYFVVCGVSRLARFNVTAEALADVNTGKVKYFEGTPIPTSIVIVAVLGVRYSVRADRRAALVRCLPTRAGDPASARPDLCGERQRHDQRDAQGAETLSPAGQTRYQADRTCGYARMRSSLVMMAAARSRAVATMIWSAGSP